MMVDTASSVGGASFGMSDSRGAFTPAGGSVQTQSGDKRRRRRTKKRFSKELKIKQESEKKMLQLQQQLMFLRWRKVQTGAKMRQILADSKRFKTLDEASMLDTRQVLEEKSQWMQEVVESEMAKPLEVDDDYIQGYIKESKNSTRRLEQDTQCHLRNVQKLKETVLRGENLRMRNRRYKDKLSMARGVPSVRTPSHFVQQQEALTNAKLDKLDALEQHLLAVKTQVKTSKRTKAGLYDEPSLSSSTDLFLLRVPPNMGGPPEI